AAPHPVDDGEVRGGQDAQVLTVLPVDALDVLRDHELDPGAHLGVGRLLTRRALAPALAAHRGDEARALHRAAGDGNLVAPFQPQVGKVAQGFVVVVADVRGGDFVGGDVVAELGRGLPVDILPVELSA